jgi:hypothetical protein
MPGNMSPETSTEESPGAYKISPGGRAQDLPQQMVELREQLFEAELRVQHLSEERDICRRNAQHLENKLEMHMQESMERLHKAKHAESTANSEAQQLQSGVRELKAEAASLREQLAIEEQNRAIAEAEAKKLQEENRQLLAKRGEEEAIELKRLKALIEERENELQAAQAKGEQERRESEQQIDGLKMQMAYLRSSTPRTPRTPGQQNDVGLNPKNISDISEEQSPGECMENMMALHKTPTPKKPNIPALKMAGALSNLSNHLPQSPKAAQSSKPPMTPRTPRANSTTSHVPQLNMSHTGIRLPISESPRKTSRDSEVRPSPRTPRKTTPRSIKTWQTVKTTWIDNDVTSTPDHAGAVGTRANAPTAKRQIIPKESPEVAKENTRTRPVEAAGKEKTLSDKKSRAEAPLPTGDSCWRVKGDKRCFLFLLSCACLCGVGLILFYVANHSTRSALLMQSPSNKHRDSSLAPKQMEVCASVHAEDIRTQYGSHAEYEVGGGTDKVGVNDRLQGQVDGHRGEKERLVEGQTRRDEEVKEIQEKLETCRGSLDQAQLKTQRAEQEQGRERDKATRGEPESQRSKEMQIAWEKDREDLVQQVDVLKAGLEKEKEGRKEDERLCDEARERTMASKKTVEEEMRKDVEMLRAEVVRLRKEFDNSTVKVQQLSRELKTATEKLGEERTWAFGNKTRVRELTREVEDMKQSEMENGAVWEKERLRLTVEGELLAEEVARGREAERRLRQELQESQMLEEDRESERRAEAQAEREREKDRKKREGQIDKEMHRLKAVEDEWARQRERLELEVAALRKDANEQQKNVLRRGEEEKDEKKRQLKEMEAASRKAEQDAPADKAAAAVAASVERWAHQQDKSLWPEHIILDLSSLSSWASQRHNERERERERLLAEIARLISDTS